MVTLNFYLNAKVHFLFELTKKIADILENTCYFVFFYYLGVVKLPTSMR